MTSGPAAIAGLVLVTVGCTPSTERAQPPLVDLEERALEILQAEVRIPFGRCPGLGKTVEEASAVLLQSLRPLLPIFRDCAPAQSDGRLIGCSVREGAFAVRPALGATRLQELQGEFFLSGPGPLDWNVRGLSPPRADGARKLVAPAEMVDSCRNAPPIEWWVRPASPPPRAPQPDVASLATDGILDIDVIACAADDETAIPDLHKVLIASGFAGPARPPPPDAPVVPLTRSMTIGGTRAEVEIRLFELKEAAMRDGTGRARAVDSLGRRDVVAVGCPLEDPTLRPPITEEELATVPLPTGRDQVLLLDGLLPWRAAEAMGRNRFKPGGAGLDLLVLSNDDSDSALPIGQLLSILTTVDADGAQVPRPYSDMLWNLTAAWSYGTYFMDDPPP